MKQLTHYLLACLLLTTILLSSCAKKEETTPTTTEDMTAAEANIRGSNDDGSTFNLIDSESEVQPGVKKTDGGSLGYFLEGASAQPIITLDTVSVAGHRLLKFDFGSTGIYCPKDNKTRKGVVKCDIVGRYRANGSSCLASFETFRVSNGNQVGQPDTKFAVREGTMNIAYEKNTATNNLWRYTETVSNAKITYPDGKSISWNGTRTRTWYKGADANPNINDFSNDYWTIENNMTGKGTDGVSYTEVTDPSDPLRFEPAKCATNFTSGKTTIKIQGKADRIIDYGKNAACDKAVVTVGGKDFIITLF